MRLELVLAATNRASGPIADVRRSLRDLNAGLERGASHANAALARTQTAVSRVGTAFSRAAGTVTHFGAAGARALQGVRVAAGHASAAVGQVASAAGRLQGVAQGAALVTGGGLATALALVSKRGVDMNLSVQGAQTALTKLLGSSTAASRFIGDLRTEAARSIPTFKDLVPLATQLVQAYGPANLGKVLPTIRAFGDAASIAAGGDSNRMGLALLGFRQLLSRGVVQQEELNQIGENLGVSVTNILKRAFGTADTETLTAAGITGAQVADAIVAGLQAQFGGAQQTMAKTLPGLVSNIGDAFDAISARVTGGFTERLRQAADAFLGFLNRLQQSAVGVKILNGVARAMNALGDAVIYAASRFPAFIAQAGPFFAGFTKGVAGVARFVASWVGSQDVLRGVAGGLANIAGLLQTVAEVALKIDFGKVFDQKNVLAWFDAAWLGVQAFIRGAFAMGRVFAEVGRMILSGIEAIWDALADTAHFLTTNFRLGVTGIRIALRGLLAGVALDLADVLDSLGPLKGLISRITGKNLDAAILGLRDGAFNMAGEAITEAGDAALEFEHEQKVYASERAARDRERAAADPRRGMAPWERVAGAWHGQWGRGSEPEFFAALQRNTAAAYARIRGGIDDIPSTAGATSAGLPPAGPLLVGQSLPRVPSVQTVPGVPAPGAPPAQVNVNVGAAGPEIFRDPRFARALEEFIRNWQYGQGQQAYPAPG